MGTDVYLKWDKQTKEDKEAQYTGFDIDAGKVGYLRASIGMLKENAILRALFPAPIWEGKGSFKFEENWEKANKLCLVYILSEVSGIELPIDEGQKKQIEFGNSVTEIFKKAGVEKIQATSNNGFYHALMWAKSLLDFMALGIEKEDKKLNPKVVISW